MGIDEHHPRGARLIAQAIAANVDAPGEVCIRPSAREQTLLLPLNQSERIELNLEVARR